MLVHSTCISIRASRSIWIAGGELENSVLEGLQDCLGLMIQSVEGGDRMISTGGSRIAVFEENFKGLAALLFVTRMGCKRFSGRDLDTPGRIIKQLPQLCIKSPGQVFAPVEAGQDCPVALGGESGLEHVGDLIDLEYRFQKEVGGLADLRHRVEILPAGEIGGGDPVLSGQVMKHAFRKKRDIKGR